MATRSEAKRENDRFAVNPEAHGSRAVCTAQESSDDRPQHALKIPARQGGIYALAENVSSPFQAEPAHPDNQSLQSFPSKTGVSTGASAGASGSRADASLQVLHDLCCNAGVNILQ